MSHIICVSTSSPPDQVALKVLEQNLEKLRSEGHTVKDQSHHDKNPKIRAEILMEALMDKSADTVLCSRGGYGASELLPFLDYELLKKSMPNIKQFVGFSDVCALHSAFYTHELDKIQLVHGPMPASIKWYGLDRPKLFSTKNPIFGGNLSVLSNLIGTPYMPKNFFDHILFFEELNEPTNKCLRAFTHWKQAGLLEGVKSIILGAFTLGDDILGETTREAIQELLHGYPIYINNELGHIENNCFYLLGPPNQRSAKHSLNYT